MQFETHDASKEIGALGSWLLTRAHKDEPVAMAIRDRTRKLALCSLDDAWVIDLKSPAGPIAIATLRAQLLEQAAVKLTCRNLATDMREFCQMMAPLWGITPLEAFKSLEHNFVGCLTQAALCINQAVTPPAKFRQLEHAAYEVALLLPQYETGIAPYYEKIGVPLAKIQVETALTRKGPAEWWVTYEHLWLKVLAGFTGDPTLCWALFNEHDPIEACAKVFKSSKEDARLMLLWQVCGRDPYCFGQRFPSLVSNLPESPQEEWNDVIDRGLPSMSAVCADMVRAYVSTNRNDDHTVNSLYKRRLRPGHPPGEAVAFRIFGTVEELLNILAVTLWQNRDSGSTIIKKYEGGPADDVVRVLGAGPQGGQITWLETVKELAPLANPLGGEILLKPRVTLAPRS